PERGRAVEEVMLAGPFPNEVPGIRRIDANRPISLTGRCLESARMFCLGGALPIGCGVGVVSGRRRHKPNAKHAAVRGIAETFDGLSVASIGLREGAAERG